MNAGRRQPGRARPGGGRAVRGSRRDQAAGPGAARASAGPIRARNQSSPPTPADGARPPTTSTTARRGARRPTRLGAGGDGGLADGPDDVEPRRCGRSSAEHRQERDAGPDGEARSTCRIGTASREGGGRSSMPRRSRRRPRRSPGRHRRRPARRAPPPSTRVDAPSIAEGADDVVALAARAARSVPELGACAPRPASRRR